MKIAKPQLFNMYNVHQEKLKCSNLTAVNKPLCVKMVFSAHYLVHFVIFSFF